ncbi:hypothetical protein tb265_14650 [Gemmatimonadetes bacterium T265]|nr:hypothetical protein tb265_14650 [Gemmatimonadetes bacterium T265]
MKATIDFDDALYRRLKIEAARRGRTIRDLVADGVRQVLNAPDQPSAHSNRREHSATTDAVVGDQANSPERPLPSWVGALRSYAKHANGVHDMASIRESIARGRAAEWAERSGS